MDETTAALLARFQRQSRKADRLFDRADITRATADRIERQQCLPDHLRPPGDEATRLLEAKLLRDEAAALETRAAEMQRALYRAPPDILNRQIEDWIAGLNPGRDREDRER